MIALSPTCHDAVHHGPLVIGDETIYRPKGIERSNAKTRDHVYVEPGESSLLALGTIGITGQQGVPVFDLGPSNKVSFYQITSNPGGDQVPGSWSPNGKRIVFQRFGPTGEPEGVFVVHLNGTGLKRILSPTTQANCCTFNWSPQGKEIAFSRHVMPDLHSSLWVMHSDGTGLRPVSVPPSLGCGGANSDPSAVGCLEPAFSPDGTQIAFASGLDLDTDGEIYTVNVDGTGLKQVTHAGGSLGPDWGTHPLTH